MGGGSAGISDQVTGHPYETKAVYFTPCLESSMFFQDVMSTLDSPAGTTTPGGTKVEKRASTVRRHVTLSTDRGSFGCAWHWSMGPAVAPEYGQHGPSFTPKLVS